MKIISIFAGVAAAAVLAASGAQATTFLLTFTSSVGSTSGLTLDANVTAPDTWQITSVTGDINGNPAILNSPIFPGDNVLNFGLVGSTFQYYFSEIDLIAGVNKYELSEVITPGFNSYIRCCGSRALTSVDTLSLTDISVPEPAAWALMILGFGGVAAALRARRTRLA